MDATLWTLGHTDDCPWARHVASLLLCAYTPELVGSRMRTRCDCGLAARTTDGPADDDETLGLTGRENGDWR